MKQIESPFANTQIRAKPWFQLRSEETSYIIYNAYRMHFLKSEDVNKFIWKHRIQQVAFWLFPLIAAVPVKFISRRTISMSRKYTKENINISTWALLGLSWWTFSKISPFKKQYDAEKDRLLNYLDANMGLAMLHFNNMLPRHWTENWVNGYTAQLYRQRNSRLTGIVYPYEGATNSIRDADEFPETSEAGY